MCFQKFLVLWLIGATLRGKAWKVLSFHAWSLSHCAPRERQSREESSNGLPRMLETVPQHLDSGTPPSGTTPSCLWEISCFYFYSEDHWGNNILWRRHPQGQTEKKKVTLELECGHSLLAYQCSNSSYYLLICNHFSFYLLLTLAVNSSVCMWERKKTSVTMCAYMGNIAYIPGAAM